MYKGTKYQQRVLKRRKKMKKRFDEELVAWILFGTITYLYSHVVIIFILSQRFLPINQNSFNNPPPCSHPCIWLFHIKTYIPIYVYNESKIVICTTRLITDYANDVRKITHILALKYLFSYICNNLHWINCGRRCVWEDISESLLSGNW